MSQAGTRSSRGCVACRSRRSHDEPGWNALIARLRGLPVAAIGLEPSGGYERGGIRALLAASLSVRRINPNRLRQFARARGALAKNDRLDARLIAEYVATMPKHFVRHDPAAARIAEIVTMRRQLCGEHVPGREPVRAPVARLLDMICALKSLHGIVQVISAAER